MGLTMPNVIFEYTDHSMLAAQGGSPSGREGYHIWLKYDDNSGYDWLGFFPFDELTQWTNYYQQQGYDIYLKEKP